ncbi:MAG: FAD-dependent monooxygenase [Candidatus Tyrphobacter sp.]
MEKAELVIVGCGPAGATAAREASRAGIACVVLEKDAVVGAKRVCAAGLRPGFCGEFDLPRGIVHFDTPRLALFDGNGAEHEIEFGPGHTTTREELDGTMASLARAEGADIRTRALFRSVVADGDGSVVEYADERCGERKRIKARCVFLVPGSTARLESTPVRYRAWPAGLMTTLQYRIYLDRPARPIAYETLEMHYYRAAGGRHILGWMFPKKDHLAIGLGVIGKMEGAQLRAELDSLTARIAARLYADSPVRGVKTEGHLLYMGAPRPVLARDGIAVGGTAAGLVDATNGEGIYEAAMSFVGRLKRRVRLISFLEREPRRFGALFEQLATTPRLPEILYGDARRRTLGDRAFLYAQLARFLVSAA